jgi:Zn finger protein HypA/HybF involved in hydrogenase expression
MAQNVRFGNPRNAVNLKKKTELQGNEYGKAGKGVVICEICHNVFFKKGWRKPGSVPAAGGKFSNTETHFVLCPACKMKKGGLYGGKLTITNIPVETREELSNLISGFGRRALERNPQDRIMDIKIEGSTFLITTNNDELAAKLGKKITDTFRKTKKKISFSSEPEEVSHVEINFLS